MKSTPNNPTQFKSIRTRVCNYLHLAIIRNMLNLGDVCKKTLSPFD